MRATRNYRESSSDDWVISASVGVDLFSHRVIKKEKESTKHVAASEFARE